MVVTDMTMKGWNACNASRSRFVDDGRDECFAHLKAVQVFRELLGRGIWEKGVLAAVSGSREVLLILRRVDFDDEALQLRKDWVDNLRTLGPISLS